MEDEIKQAEARGYVKGYAAGQRRFDKGCFRRDVFLAALPTCIEVNGWKFGDDPITSVIDRTALAWEFADEALKRAKLL